MKIGTFFQKFELFADATDAVAKMRELVLELAVQGKVVEQRANERSAYECISDANKALMDFRRDELRETPSGWVALPLGCVIASNIGGGTPSKANPLFWNGPIPWASVKDVQSDKYLVSTIDSITELGLKNSSSNLIPPRRLLVVTRMGLGKLAINKVSVAINQDLRAIEPTTALDLDFAYLLFKSLKMIGSGVTVKGITVDKLHAMPVALPPLAEQKRIVAKVDELMAVCDRLEEQLKKRDTRHAALSRAALARFAEAPTPANLDFLFHPSYVIPPAELRKSILTLAVQGKLVRQDPDDEPVDRQLKRLAALTAEEGSSMNSLQPMEADALPFDLPPSWKWVQAQDLCTPCGLITYGILKPVWVDVGVPTIRVQDMQGGNIVLDGVGQCAPERAAKFTKTTLKAGDLLIAKDGATLGKTAFVPPELEGGNITQHVLRFPITPHMDRSFIRLVIDSPHGQAWMRSETKGVALPGVNVGDFRRMPIPLPPVAEQKRIVAKVDELMAVVDALENQLATALRNGADLLTAAVAELTNAKEPHVAAEV